MTIGDMSIESDLVLVDLDAVWKRAGKFASIMNHSMSHKVSLGTK